MTGIYWQVKWQFWFFFNLKQFLLINVLKILYTMNNIIPLITKTSQGEKYPKSEKKKYIWKYNHKNNFLYFSSLITVFLINIKIIITKNNFIEEPSELSFGFIFWIGRLSSTLRSNKFSNWFDFISQVWWTWLHN